MNDLYKVTIGLGDKRGVTTHIIMQQSKSKIERQQAKDGKNVVPRIKIKELPELDMGSLGTLLRNKRNKNTLKQMLKLDNIDTTAINLKSENLMKNLIEEQQMLGVFAQQNQDEKENDKFVKETGGTVQEAKKYRNKYKGLDNSIKVYKEHQTKIKRFMELNNCSKDNAITFLQSNNYDMGLFE